MLPDQKLPVCLNREVSRALGIKISGMCFISLYEDLKVRRGEVKIVGE